MRERKGLLARHTMQYRTKRRQTQTPSLYFLVKSDLLLTLHFQILKEKNKGANSNFLFEALAVQQYCVIEVMLAS